jgi:lysophospholipase L1-like esterase
VQPRILVYGDSNSWGYPDDGSGIRMAADTRWPQVMGAALGREVIEDCLCGRTTAHDDPLMWDQAMNGLRHIATAVRAQAPLDTVVIMLGTNDFKNHLGQTTAMIADNVGRLVDRARKVGGGAAGWDDVSAPAVFVICPPQIGPLADDPEWVNAAMWQGAHGRSRDIAVEMERMGRQKSIPVFNAGTLVSASAIDPIHLGREGHRQLGAAVAQWIQART